MTLFFNCSKFMFGSYFINSILFYWFCTWTVLLLLAPLTLKLIFFFILDQDEPQIAAAPSAPEKCCVFLKHFCSSIQSTALMKILSTFLAQGNYFYFPYDTLFHQDDKKYTIWTKGLSCMTIPPTGTVLTLHLNT